MSAFKVFNLLAVTTLALLVTSFGATPVNALAHGGHHLNRQIHHAEVVAKRGKRANNKRCKTRPTSTLVSSSPAATTPAATTPAPVATETPKSSSTAAPAPATTSTSSGGSNGGNTYASGKRLMIAWNNPDPSQLALTVGPNTGSVYTWSVWKPTSTFGATFFPQFWGNGKQGELSAQVPFGTYSDLLFFNEPDQGGQSNIDPWAAAGIWKSTFAQYGSSGARLWSPAVTSSPDGEKWMDNFMGACSGCNIYGIAFHWYGTNPDELIAFVEKMKSKYNMPLALTEFACQDFATGHVASMDEIWTFYKKVMPYLMTTNGLHHVAPFGFLQDMGNVNPNNQLLRGNALTDLGNYIVYGPY